MRKNPLSGFVPVQLKPLLHYFGTEPVSEQRSRIMARIRGRDTKPELTLRRAVWALGGRFRVNVKTLPGRPDFANQRAKLVVFVDGCFWHGCPDHFRAPKTRRRYWTEKIKRNQERRDRVRAAYGSDWTVLEFLECTLTHDLESSAKAIVRLLRN